MKLFANIQELGINSVHRCMYGRSDYIETVGNIHSNNISDAFQTIRKTRWIHMYMFHNMQDMAISGVIVSSLN